MISVCHGFLRFDGDVALISVFLTIMYHTSLKKGAEISFGPNREKYEAEL
jgi:hypothetical protein